jgi:xylan 1,4-beta-xylosidase
VTKSAKGEVEIAAWNLVDPDRHGSRPGVDFEFLNVPADAQAGIQRVDSEHGNVLPNYAAMGKRLDPTPEQVEELNRERAPALPDELRLKGGRLKLSLASNTLALIKVET